MKWRRKNPERNLELKRAYWARNKERLNAEQVARYTQAVSSPALRAELANKKRMMRYGITREWYDAMLAAQGGGCAICETKEPGHGRRYFSVDHDHKTKEPRALLCGGCNILIGFAKEDHARLMAAAEYVWKHSLPALKRVG